MKKFIKPFISMLTLCTLLTLTTNVKAVELNTTNNNNSIEKVESYAPTSDFGNKVQSIKITVKNTSSLDLKASDFHIEFPKLVNGVTEI